MQSIITSIVIAFLICNALTISSSKASVHTSENETDLCSQYKDCFSCVGDQECGVWYCLSPNAEPNDMLCKNTSYVRPKEPCQGKWHKLDSPDKCDSLNISDPNSEVVTNIKHSISYANTLINDECSDHKDCDTCFDDNKCAFWWCSIGKGGEWSGDMSCQHPTDPKPNSTCTGRWKRMEHQHGEKTQNCSTIHKKNETASVATTGEELSDEDCSGHKDCLSCFDDPKCAFWWCAVSKKGGEWTGDMICQTLQDPKPNTTVHHCAGHWRSMEHQKTSQNCSTIHTKNSTTTTTTHSPETTTGKSTTTSSTKSPPTSPPGPHEGEGRLTGWTIAGITICSILVVVILIGVSYKKVMKIYRARNPYRTLND